MARICCFFTENGCRPPFDTRHTIFIFLKWRKNYPAELNLFLNYDIMLKTKKSRSLRAAAARK